MKAFWLSFVPLFVAVDAIGVLPMFMSLSQGIDPVRVRRVVFQSVITAMAVALLFMAVGTALLTTSVLLTKVHGFPVTVIAVVVNILLAGVLFRFAGSVQRILGKTGEKIVSKIASLLLAAYAVMMVRRGIELFIS
jgi:small neutral amino acid transporter SnatA (MarC family)